LLGGLGFGWFTKKMADRKAAKEEQRLRDEEDLRSGTSLSRFTADPYDSPGRRDDRRPIQRRQTGYPPTETVLSTEMSESTIEPRPTRGNYVDPAEKDSTVIPVGRAGNHSRRNSLSPGSRAQRSRQGRDDDSRYDRYASPASVSVKMKVHDDKDRNVTLRRLTEEEAIAARGRRDSASSISGLESPTQGRRRYRRDSSHKRAESRAEENDDVASLAPPNPTFAKQKRRGKDSAYYSGQQAPSIGNSQFNQTVSSLAESHGTWSGITPSVNTAPPGPAIGGPAAEGSAAAENRRNRRRLERRRASGQTADAPATNVDMFD
jgi:hypothetical protein